MYFYIQLKFDKQTLESHGRVDVGKFMTPVTTKYLKMYNGTTNVDGPS